MTHREFRTWREWLDNQWNVPDRHDFYIMRLIAEVNAILSKQRTIDANKFKLTFDRVIPSAEKLKKDIHAISKQAQDRWIGMLGIKDRVVRKRPEDNGS